jgi:predicted nucleic acid-binding protein
VSTPLLRIVVTDANVLINLMHVSRLGLLAQIPNYEFVVPDHVREEITLPEQRTTLDAAVTAGWLKLEVIDDLGAITVFTELIAHIGRGDERGRAGDQGLPHPAHVPS